MPRKSGAPKRTVRPVARPKRLNQSSAVRKANARDRAKSARNKQRAASANSGIAATYRDYIGRFMPMHPKSFRPGPNNPHFPRKSRADLHDPRRGGPKRGTRYTK